MPQVSVVIPVYNADAYLEQCLGSIVSQTLKEIEIICVDDGSTDRSYGILQRFAEQDDRIVLLQQKNQYAGVARNAGLKAARGEYVIFLDADDFFDCTMLEKMHSQAVFHNADITVCGAQNYDAVNGKITPAPHRFRSLLVKGMEVFSKRDIPDEIMNITSPASWNKLYRRKFLLEEGLEFQPLHNTNDCFLTEVAMCVAKRIAYVDEPLVNYRKGQSSNLQSSRQISPCDFMVAFEAVYDDLHRRGIFQEVEKSFVRFVVENVAYQVKSFQDHDEKFAVFGEMRKPHFARMGVFSYPDDFYPDKGALNAARGAFHALDWHNRFSIRGHESFPVIKISARPATLITVLIQTENIPEGVVESIGSILRQSWEDFEILLIANGAACEDLNELKVLASRDERISLFSQGLSPRTAAKNIGIEHAKGKYLWFFPVGCVLAPYALEHLCAVLEELCLDGVYFDEGNVESEQVNESRAEFLAGLVKCRDGRTLMRELKSKRMYRSSVSAQIVKTDFLRRTEIRFAEETSDGNDLFTFCTMLAAGRTGYFPRDFYRQSAERQMVRADPFEKVYEKFYAFMKGWQYVQHVGLKDDNLPAALSVLQDFLSAARNLYQKLSGDARCSWWGLPRTQGLLFKALVADECGRAQQLGSAKKQLQNIKKENLAWVGRFESMQKDAAKMKKRLSCLENSRSYRLGRAVTYVPRKIKDTLCRWRQHGLACTVKSILRKSMRFGKQ
ncbi:glycosyltransferase [Pyramidobacter sp. SM-530-WT-4B]|uniref:Glycosyltransferase n=1 Tax=Pyramidobacter porci TaxID=2605789 RepID=A0A6L5YDT7_9BACT|nr:glycosyltransferase [Pyramidobacter porci]MST56359.1 glycosyltransferase [Pyramidobacter porci]